MKWLIYRIPYLKISFMGWFLNFLFSMRLSACNPSIIKCFFSLTQIKLLSGMLHSVWLSIVFFDSHKNEPLISIDGIHRKENFRTNCSTNAPSILILFYSCLQITFINDIVGLAKTRTTSNVIVVFRINLISDSLTKWEFFKGEGEGLFWSWSLCHL